MKEHTKYFYCQSYQVFNLALYYRFILKEKVIVITAADNLLKACQFLDVEVIRHENFSPRSFITKSSQVKNEVSKLYNVIKDGELHFSHTQFALFCFLLVKKHSESGKSVVFHDFEMVYDRFKMPFNNFSTLKLRVKQLLINIIYKGLYAELRQANKKNVMLSLPLKYIRKNFKIEAYSGNRYFEQTIKLFKNFELNIASADYLFIAQFVDIDGDLADNLKSSINNVFETLSKYKFVVKMHPKLGDIDSLKKLEVIPDFLPVELAFNSVNKAVVSFSSESLITASKFTKFTTISLIDIIINEDEFYIIQKNRLDRKSNGNIKFLKSASELEKILER